MIYYLWIWGGSGFRHAWRVNDKIPSEKLIYLLLLFYCWSFY